MSVSLRGPADPDGPTRTILLLGGTGFIGTNLAASLRGAGHRLLLAGRSPAARDGHPAIDLPLADTAAIVALIEAEGVDAVVHLACGLLPSSNEAAYGEEQARVNLPTIALARALATRDVGLVFLSSGGTIYGEVTAVAAESDPCRPISLYGQAKLEIELHLAFLARTCGLRLLVLRPSNPYGAYQRRDGAQGLVSVILGRIAADRPLDIWGDGSAVRDYIFIDDAIEGVAGLIERRAEGIFNIGSGVGHSLLDVVKAAEAATGRRVALNFHPSRAADVPRLVLDVSRLAGLGLHRSRPLAEGVRRYACDLGMAHYG